MADYFDRLLARSAPEQDAIGDDSPGVVRVRPRLPGPFERVETLGTRTRSPLDGDGTDGFRPPESGAQTASEGLQPPQHRLVVRNLTERRIVGPAGPVQPSDGRPAPAAGPVAPLLVPSPLPSATPARSAERERVRARPGGGATGPGTDATREAARTRNVSGTTADGSSTADRARPVAVPARPAGPAGGRDGRSAGRSEREGRGGGRTPERVVHVTIGRLEVRAAGRNPGGVGGAREAGRNPSARPAPVMSLDSYLSRPGKEGGR